VLLHVISLTKTNDTANVKRMASLQLLTVPISAFMRSNIIYIAIRLQTMSQTLWQNCSLRWACDFLRAGRTRAAAEQPQLGFALVVQLP